MRKSDNPMRMKPPLISTGLQPVIGGRRVTSAVSPASRARGKAVKTAGCSPGRWVTGLKPGVNEKKHLEITEASYVAGDKPCLVLNDGKKRVMDFEPILRHARNPMITKYRQVRNFKRFHLHFGDLMWGDYDMIFPIADLHHGNILKGEVTAPAHFVLSDAAAPGKTVSEKKAKTVAAVSYKKAPPRRSK
jgi:hypothetical protein